MVTLPDPIPQPSPNKGSRDAKIRALHSQGLTQAEIATKFGVSLGLILKLLAVVSKRANLATRPRFDARDATIRALRRQGLTQAETATKLGVSQALISKVERS